MQRRDFIKYSLGCLATLCLTGNFEEDVYYDDICLGKYKSHTISYSYDKPEYYYLGDLSSCVRYVTFPKEFILTIKYSYTDVKFTGFNINLKDIPEIISKKPEDLLINDNKIILNCKHGEYIFRISEINPNEFYSYLITHNSQNDRINQ